MIEGLTWDDNVVKKDEMDSEKNFFRAAYEDAMLKAFPESFTALRIKIEEANTQDLSKETAKDILQHLRKIMVLPQNIESGHINLLGKYRALQVLPCPEGIRVSFAYHGAGTDPGVQKERGMLFNSEPVEIIIPRGVMGLSEAAENLGINAFDLIGYQHFPEITREDYWMQQPNNKEKIQIREYQKNAQALFEKEKEVDLDLDYPFDDDFSIRFPELVEYLMELRSVFHAEKNGLEVAMEVKESIQGEVEGVLIAE